MKRFILALAFAFYVTGALAQNPGITYKGGTPPVVGNPATFLDKFHVTDGGAVPSGTLSFTYPGTGGTLRTGTDKWEDVLNVRDFGALPNSGANENVHIQAAITEAATRGRIVEFDCGTYLINATLTLPSHAHLRGVAPGCVILKETATMPAYAPFAAKYGCCATAFIITNNDYTAGQSTQTDFIIEDIGFDTTLSTVNTHAILFDNASVVRITRAICTGSLSAASGDCTAFVGVNDAIVTGSNCSGMTNTCYDMWEGSTNIRAILNYGSSSLNGLNFNGTSTTGSASPSSNLIATGNIFTGMTGNCMWMQGGSASGTISDFTLNGNQCSVSGIRVSEGSRGAINSNLFLNITGTAISIVKEASGAYSCKYCSIDGNVVGGTTPTFAISADSTTQNLIIGSSNNWGTGSPISIANSATAWTTGGIRQIVSPQTINDNTSSGTVITAYADFIGATTVTATSATTYTNFYNRYIKAPVASTNVTMTAQYALGVDSLFIGGAGFLSKSPLIVTSSTGLGLSIYNSGLTHAFGFTVDNSTNHLKINHNGGSVLYDYDTAGNQTNTGTQSATGYLVGATAGVDCTIGTLNPVTAVVSKGIITHC